MASDDQDNLKRHHRELAEKLQTLFRTERVEGLAAGLDKRLRLIPALRVIANFLKRTNVGDDIAREFGDHAGELSDLDKGQCSAALTPAKGSGGRLVDRHDVWKVRVNVVFGFVALISTGLSEKQAAEYIADRYPDLERVKHNRKDELKNSILSWHGHFHAETAGGRRKKSGDDEIQDAFACSHQPFLEELKARSIEDCKKLADDLLSAASREAEELIVSGVEG